MYRRAVKMRHAARKTKLIHWCPKNGEDAPTSFHLFSSPLTLTPSATSVLEPLNMLRMTAARNCAM